MVFVDVELHPTELGLMCVMHLAAGLYIYSHKLSFLLLAAESKGQMGL